MRLFRLQSAATLGINIRFWPCVRPYDLSLLGCAGPASLSLSSSMLDTDKLRRCWPLSPAFSSLQSLDLSGNLIHAIEAAHLAGLPRLQELSLARNKLRSLSGIEILAGSLVRLDASGNLVDSLADGCLLKCELLEELNLAGNNIKSPLEVEGLSRLPHLSLLDLRVNPVSSTASARLFTVFHLRALVRLDGADVTLQERQAVGAPSMADMHG